MKHNVTMTASQWKTVLLLLLLFTFFPLDCPATDRMIKNDDTPCRNTRQQIRAAARLHAQMQKEHVTCLQLDPSNKMHYSFLLNRGALSENALVDADAVDTANHRFVPSNEGIEVAEPNHIIASLIFENGKLSASASSRVRDDATFAFVDVVVFNKDLTKQLTVLGYHEEYGAGEKVLAKTSGEIPDFEHLMEIVVSSLEKTEIRGQVYYHYIEKTMLLDKDKIQPFKITAPSDQNEDGMITVCLNSNDSHCDFNVLNEQYIKLPFKGSLMVPFSIAKEDILADGTYIKMMGVNSVEPDAGSATMDELVVDDGDGERSFSDYIFIVPQDSGTLLTWNIAQQYAWFKNRELYRQYPEVNWYLTIGIQTPAKKDIFWTITNDSDANAGTRLGESLRQIQFVD